MTAPIVKATGINHVRISVTDIKRSKAFYQALFGEETAFDFSDQVDEPGVMEDQEKLYGGTGFMVGGQLFGLRPVGVGGGTFDPTRVGLDHLSFQVDSAEDLADAAERLTAAGFEHSGVQDLPAVNMKIVSIQDPDDINIELVFGTDG